MTDRQDVSPWPFVGMAGMACAFFLYAASVLFAPWWSVLLMLLVWAVLLVVACAWWSLHPRWVPGVALVAIAGWAGYVWVVSAA